MPRDGSNTYSLPEAPFVPNTVALASVINSDLNDIATALTDSFTRAETTTFTRTLLDDTDAATARATLGVGTAPQAAAQVATTSGLSAGFTGITAGAMWVELMLTSVRTTAAAQVICELGHGGGPTYLTSGYVSTLVAVEAAQPTIGAAFTTGFPLLSTAAERTGILSLRRTNSASNVWIATAQINPEGSAANALIIGRVTLPAALSAIRITTSSAFNLGAINLAWGV
jgi:hypothetical protein